MPTQSDKFYGAGLGAVQGGIQVPLTAASLDRLVLLECKSAAGSAADYIMLRSMNKGVAGQYKVPTGKTLYILCSSSWPAATNLIGYGAAALIANRTATAPTTPIYLSATSTRYPLVTFQVSVATTPFHVYTIPADMYPFVRTSDTIAFTASYAGAILL